LSWIDPLVLLWAAFAGLVGYQRGLSAQALSLAGLVLGALAGSRLAPLFLADGSRSPWVPFASLVGAVVVAVAFQIGAVALGDRLRRRVEGGPLQLADSLGGVVLGAAIGLAVAWLAAVAALQVQGSSLRRTVQDSAVLSELVGAVPPSTVLQAIARFDPLPLLALPPDLQLPPPDGSVLQSPVTRRVGASVVKVLSVACGTGSQGSGWIVLQGFVATNAHVVAGQEQTQVIAPSGEVAPAFPVYVDPVDDVALLAAPGLSAPALDVSAELMEGEEVVLLGYPRDGPLTATAATAGLPRKLLAPDAYGTGRSLRSVVPLRGPVRRGESGGPVVDARGEVVAMMFASARDGDAGFAVPVEEVLQGLESPLRPVSAGPCPG